MGILMRIISILAALVFLLSALSAGGLFWEFNFGDCKGGCAEGMAYIFFLPSLILALITLLVAIGAHIYGNRIRRRSKAVDA